MDYKINHELKKRTNFLEILVNKAPGLLYCKDREGIYMGCNETQAKIVGLQSSDELIGKTDFDFLEKEQAEKLRKNDLEIIQGGIAKNLLEEEIILPNGKKAIFSSSKQPVYNDAGEIVGLIGISVNITELKQAQEREKAALQKAAAEEATKRAMLVFSGMSTHDLRTPISSIALRASFLDKYLSKLIDDYKTKTEPIISIKVLNDLEKAPINILQAVKEANEYIDSSLKCLKAASEGESLINSNQLIICNTDRLLRRIIDNYPFKDNEKELLHWNSACDFSFKGNIIFFNRLIENLVKNAYEQIHIKGKGEIYIECECKDECNQIKIKDTAGGVTETLIDQLFLGIHSNKTEGTGIGLSSAKQIMHNMNGKIEARLVEGDCIEFILSFPLLDKP